ncbi:enoyl-CoA hydratase-related protein [Sporosarcina sp. ACRSL]|uniref:enoyl-CoA hydratase/isomerase family protein n=1 Tax=Sporosarcina sp. ACRSL TaxID=2918215 RepID=UPI001EF6F833|nr:enoyl-CoA hydratase-related protein [Sporosarcina sp. ACRSL]MCG7344080.1 enoyl-CoA hydratase-related protein [Sporosarcina sp. ACRSL]
MQATTSKWETISLNETHAEDHVYILELNRPEAMNALNTLMAIELKECLTMLKDKKDLRVLVLTGAGQKSFCAGADLRERKTMDNEQWKKQHDIFEDTYDTLRNFPFPVIAAINGFALGGGMEMALSCDLRYMAEHAKMGLPEVTLGIIPGVGGTQLLPRAVPVALAKEFLFKGSHIPAKRAAEMGLVNDVFSSETLLEETMKAAREIARNAPLSLQAIKKAIDRGLQTDLHTALSIELDQYYKCANSEDRKEGVLAFNEKRKPNWRGI